MTDRLDLLIEALMSAAQKYVDTPAQKNPDFSILAGDWEITCGLPDHDLPNNLRLRFRIGDSGDYILETDDPESKLNNVRCEHRVTSNGIPAFETNREFMAVYPCGFAHSEEQHGTKFAHADDTPDSEPQSTRSSYDHFRSDKVRLSNGEEHFLRFYEAYVRELKRVRIAVSIIPGPDHPSGPVHNGVAHGD